MQYFRTIFISFIFLLLTGCNSTDSMTQNKNFIKLFEWTTGHFQPLAEGKDLIYDPESKTEHEIDTPELHMAVIDDNYRHVKIIDSNGSYNRFKEAYEQTFSASEKKKNLFDKADQVDFNTSRIMLVGFFGFPDPGFTDKITQPSSDKIVLHISENPFDGDLQPASGFFNIFAYQVSRNIKVVEFDGGAVVKMNDINFYSN